MKHLAPASTGHNFPTQGSLPHDSLTGVFSTPVIKSRLLKPRSHSATSNYTRKNAQVFATYLLDEPCNKSDKISKDVTSCSKLVDNLGQAMRTQLVDSLYADLLQVVRFLRV